MDIFSSYSSLNFSVSCFYANSVLLPTYNFVSNFLLRSDIHMVSLCASNFNTFWFCIRFLSYWLQFQVSAWPVFGSHFITCFSAFYHNFSAIFSALYLLLSRFIHVLKVSSGILLSGLTVAYFPVPIVFGWSFSGSICIFTELKFD